MTGVIWSVEVCVGSLYQMPREMDGCIRGYCHLQKHRRLLSLGVYHIDTGYHTGIPHYLWYDKVYDCVLLLL